MPGVKSARAHSRGSTTTDEVIRSAVRIVDEDGVDALNIRRLANECGVSAMAIYRHVRDKDDLVDRVVDDVLTRGFSEIEAEGDWRTRLVALMHGGRKLFLDHPGIADVCVRRPTPVAGVAQFFDAMLTALRDAGLDEDDRVRGFDALLMFLLGSVLWEVPRRDHERERLIAAADQRGRRGAGARPTEAPSAGATPATTSTSARM